MGLFHIITNDLSFSLLISQDSWQANITEDGLSLEVQYSSIIEIANIEIGTSDVCDNEANI